MTIARYQGTVSIPVFLQPVDYGAFNPGNVNWNTITFSPESYIPLFGAVKMTDAVLPNAGPTANAGLVMTRMSVLAPAVGGVSEMLLNSTTGGIVQQLPVTWVDGKLYTTSGYGFDGSGTVYNTAFAWQKMQRPPGNSPIQSSANRIITKITRSTFFTGMCPARSGGINGVLAHYTDLDFLLKTVLFDLSHNTYTDPLFGGPDFTGNINTAAGAISGAQILNNRIVTPRATDPDNLTVITTTTGGAVNRGVLFNAAGLGVAGVPITSELHLDNAGLDAIWSTNYDNKIQTWYNGYILNIPTGGAGPTSGQNSEVVVTNADFTQYYLVRLVPMDTASQNQLARSGATWQVKIDTDGILWFNSGANASPDASQMLYSFSRDFIGFPQITQIDIPPIVLPCWNNCIPQILFD